MTDIFRQELDIPEKTRTFGWLLLAIGGILFLLAVYFFAQESQLIQRYEAKPIDKQITTAPAKATTHTNLSELVRAQQYLSMVIMAFGIVMAFVIVITVSHRIAQHLRARPGKPPAKTPFTDPWKESADRIKIDQEYR
ncbi:MAG: hypothetical protein WC975_07010 [Phycisphaerae bacterium]